MKFYEFSIDLVKPCMFNILCLFEGLSILNKVFYALHRSSLKTKLDERGGTSSTAGSRTEFIKSSDPRDHHLVILVR